MKKISSTVLKPHVRFDSLSGHDLKLTYLCEYVEIDDSDGSEYHFGTRQERDAWRRRRGQ